MYTSIRVYMTREVGYNRYVDVPVPKENWNKSRQDLVRDFIVETERDRGLWVDDHSFCMFGQIASIFVIPVEDK